MRSIKSRYASEVEFVTLNAPLKPLSDPPDKTVLARGFKGPFYSWLRADKATGNIYTMGDTINYIVSVLNREGPFHGLLAFSQGNYVVRGFL